MSVRITKALDLTTEVKQVRTIEERRAAVNISFSYLAGHNSWDITVRYNSVKIFMGLIDIPKGIDMNSREDRNRLKVMYLNEIKKGKDGNVNLDERLMNWSKYNPYKYKAGIKKVAK